MDIEQRYEKLINYLTDYIYTVTIKDGVVVDTFHGPGCVSVTGYTSEHYKKDPQLWYRMVHHKDREKVLEQARLALAGKEVDPLEHRIIHRDGTVRWIRNKIVVTKNDDGTPAAYDGLDQRHHRIEKSRSCGCDTKPAIETSRQNGFARNPGIRHRA